MNVAGNIGSLQHFYHNFCPAGYPRPPRIAAFPADAQDSQPGVATWRNRSSLTVKKTLRLVRVAA